MEETGIAYEAAPKGEARFMLAMLAVIIGAFGYLAYGPGLANGYAGFGALFAIPFALGAIAARGSDSLFNPAGCILAPILLFALIFPIVYFGFGEGLVCILMVLPFWLAGGLGGALAVWWSSGAPQEQPADKNSTRLKASALVLLPFAVIFAEEASPPQWQQGAVTNSTIIAASADEIWPLLIEIPGISPDEGRATFTHDFIGIPRPSDAVIEQREGVSVRKAMWGEDIRFEEHLTQMEPGKQLSWRFVFPDASVQAHTDQHIDPDGPIVKITQGGYLLEQLSSGKTRLTLTTHYQMRTRLGWYFAMWGEQLLGDVHTNVLGIVKDRSEAPGRFASSAQIPMITGDSATSR